MATIVVVVVAVKKRADILVQLVACCLCICVGDHVWWLLWVGYVMLLGLLYMRVMILWIVAAVVEVRSSCYPRMVNHPTKRSQIWWRREHTTLPYQVTFQRLPLQLRNILFFNQPFIILLLLSQLSLQHPRSHLHVVHYIATIRVEPTIDLFVSVDKFLFLYVNFFLFSIVLFLLDNIFFFWFLFADGFILEEFSCRYRLLI